jgi:hypothetical protein
VGSKYVLSRLCYVVTVTSADFIASMENSMGILKRIWTYFRLNIGALCVKTRELFIFEDYEKRR